MARAQPLGPCTRLPSLYPKPPNQCEINRQTHFECTFYYYYYYLLKKKKIVFFYSFFFFLKTIIDIWFDNSFILSCLSLWFLLLFLLGGIFFFFNWHLHYVSLFAAYSHFGLYISFQYSAWLAFGLYTKSTPPFYQCLTSGQNALNYVTNLCFSFNSFMTWLLLFYGWKFLRKFLCTLDLVNGALTTCYDNNIEGR